MCLQSMQWIAAGYYNHVSSADHVMKLKSGCQPQVNTIQLHKTHAPYLLMWRELVNSISSSAPGTALLTHNM